MSTRDFLLEIGTEEIPARFLPPALKQMRELAAKGLGALGLAYRALDVYATPRRLSLLVRDLQELQPDLVTETKGPALKAAYAEDGSPTRALQGFCKSQGLEPEQLEQREIAGNRYLYAVKTQQGQAASTVLPAFCEELITKIHFPKPMRWGYQTLRFARPIHWLVALFGAEIIPVALAGVVSGRVSRGHRVLGSQQISIGEPGEYFAKLKENYVICDQEERRALVWQQIEAVAAKLGGQVEEDEELLEEVVFLLEYPTALAGSFAEKYLQIPAELVITPMREHQRYFPVYDQKGGLLNKFITVRNGDDYHLEVVAAGNEKVLRARLADAEFFWQEDLQADLAAYVERLASVVFHEKLGSLRQKVARIEKLAVVIGQALAYNEAELAQTKRAAFLAKADLSSHVVYEFPELQGIIGEYYARHAGEEAVVAQAVREHYQPRFAGDQVPESKPGIAVALADKLDSLCGFFAAGIQPTGSQDPYALRRAASGMAQIIIQNRLDLPLRDLLGQALGFLQADIPALQALDAAAWQAEVLAFFQQRLENSLAEEGLSHDLIRAAAAPGMENIYDSWRRAHALAELRGDAQFAVVLAAFTRAANLLRAAQTKEKIDTAALVLNPALLQLPAEQALAAAVEQVRAEMAPALAARDYAAALLAINGLAAATDAFFTEVMVMDEDEALKRNRLALLRQVVALPAKIGDLTQIAG